jgi:hypothetical protein
METVLPRSVYNEKNQHGLAFSQAVPFLKWHACYGKVYKYPLDG